MFGLLHETRQTYFDKFVKIAGGDGEKFYAFKERIIRVASFFEDAFVKLQPGIVTI